LILAYEPEQGKKESSIEEEQKRPKSAREEYIRNGWESKPDVTSKTGRYIINIFDIV